MLYYALSVCLLREPSLRVHCCVYLLIGVLHKQVSHLQLFAIRIEVLINSNMQLEEFKFIYEDLKSQLKEIPSLPLLLKSIEKTTKKLDCINLYSAIDKRQFDFQLFEKETFDQMGRLLETISELQRLSKKTKISMERFGQIEQQIDKIKESKMQAFDKLDKLEESLQKDIDKLVDEQMFTTSPNIDNQIKEVEEDQEEMQQSQKIKESPTNRVEVLKQEIDELNKKISKLNRGKGKWFDGDHRDFLKIYNRFGGDGQKIIEEGVKILGMKNIEIVDHLQVYENYLQLQKEKKLVSQEYKSIKMLEQQLKNQQQAQRQLSKQNADKNRKRLKEEEQQQKKLQIEEFKRKKEDEREKLIKQAEKEKEVVKKSQRLSAEKRKQIELKTKKMIQQKQQQFKQRQVNSSQSKKVKPANIEPIRPIPKMSKPPVAVKKQIL